MTRFAAAAPACLALLLSAAGAAAQDHGPRDIGGTWERYPFAFAEPDPGAPEGPGPIPDPPLKPAYLEPWRELRAEIEAATERGEPVGTGYTECVGDGMPAMMMGMFPMEVLDTGDQVTVIQEAYNQVRRIYLGDALPEPQNAEPRFAGHSAARWEGDTLVVETVGVKDYVEFRNVPHSNRMRITERISLMDDRDYMKNEVTVTDPETLDGPWTWTWMYKRWPGYKMQEYVCEQNLWTTDPETGAAVLRVEALENPQ